MKIHLIRIIATFIATAIVMIAHEFPKAFAYSIISKNQDPKKKHKIYLLHHYIDPIGMLLCITNHAGFSKPYMYRIKDQKTNFILGLTGFISLLVTFLISNLILRFGFHITDELLISDTSNIVLLLSQFITVYTSLISISMFIVNLFPMSTFDMGLLVAGKSPSKYFAIIRNDYMLKMLLLLLIIFRFIPTIGTLLLTQFLA